MKIYINRYVQYRSHKRQVILHAKLCRHSSLSGRYDVFVGQPEPYRNLKRKHVYCIAVILKARQYKNLTDSMEIGLSFIKVNTCTNNDLNF